MRTVYTLFVLVMVVCVSATFSQTNYYVDPAIGDDSWDGLSPTYVSGSNGPKATIQATVNTALPNDLLHMAGSVYNESVVIDKNLTVCCLGLSSIQNLSVTNSATVTVNDNMQISGTLTLNSGQVLVDGNHMIFVTNASPSAVAINGGRIIGTINRAIAANTTEPYVFTDANTAIVPDGNQSSVDVYVNSVPGLPPHITPGQMAINRYYFIWSGGTINAGIRIGYLDSELNGILETNLIPYRWSNGDTHWSEWPGASVNVIDNYVEVAGVTIDDWAKWTLGDVTGPLPIQLASFNAIVSNGNNVDLNWRTLTETNNYGFYVQQRNSISGEYVDLPNSFVSGHGTTLEPHDYSWTHQGLFAGTYYYRLKQVDLDGTLHFSDGREVTISSPPTSVVESHVPAAFMLDQNYPNPFNPSTQIRFTVEQSGFTTLTVFDVLGKEVKTLYAGVAESGNMYSVSFDASGIANGTYFYKLVNGGQTSLRKMLLLK